MTLNTARDRTTGRPNPTWEASSQADDARSLLKAAKAEMTAARAALAEAPPRYPEALKLVLSVFHATLRAFLAWEAEMPTSADDEFDELAGRAVRMSSVLKTPVQRAQRLAARAPAINLASRLSVHDREDVETGWYTARNLLQAVETGLPPALRLAPRVLNHVTPGLA